MASRLHSLRKFSQVLKPSYSPTSHSPRKLHACLVEASRTYWDLTRCNYSSFSSSRSFASSTVNFGDESKGPAAIDYHSILQEDEFHNLANSTIHHLQEKFEEYGDNVQVDGYDVDYGNEVLTVKLGALGTYVLNKQTPNRQIWLSSPVSGPARFDWDRNADTWVYRRTKANLLELLQSELQELCGERIDLS